MDTDWVIHWLHGKEQVKERLERAIPEGVGFSMISLAELFEGIYASPDPETNRRHLENTLRGVTLLAIDEDTCEVFGRERGRLRRAKSLIPDFDLMIAATALRFDLTLLTNNRRHFDLVQDLRLESV